MKGLNTMVLDSLVISSSIVLKASFFMSGLLMTTFSGKCLCIYFKICFYFFDAHHALDTSF